MPSGFLAFGVKVIKPFVLTPEKGARTSVYLASSPEVADVTGAVLRPSAGPQRPRRRPGTRRPRGCCGRSASELVDRAVTGPAVTPEPGASRVGPRPVACARALRSGGGSASRSGALERDGGLPCRVQGEWTSSPEERDILRIVGKSWGWVLFFGIVTLILGVLVILNPKDTIYAFAILLGIWLFVAGLFRIVMAIADHDDTGGDAMADGRSGAAVGDRRDPLPAPDRRDRDHAGLPHRPVLGDRRDHRVLHAPTATTGRRPGAGGSPWASWPSPPAW